MKYLKAYVKAWAQMMGILGPLYLFVAALQADRLLPMFLAYVCVVAALAGPIAVMLDKSKEGNVCVK